MISSVFVDRPRLAIVIAIIITIAGGLSLTRIPVAQFPDIVPPQVQVTATFPGASAAVVESAVAQPLEAQIVGVDQALYMKSTSGNDGSYNLTVSFALGTNPDIDTVNVNNRVQIALSQLPAEVQLEGLTVQKRSSSILRFMMFYSEDGQQTPLTITNYATINVLDELSRTPAGFQTTQALPVHPWSRRHGYRRRGSGGFQIIRRRLSAPSIRDNFVGDLLSLVKAAHPSALDGADVHENILGTVIRLNEAKAFLVVEPLHGSLGHETLLSGTCLNGPRTCAAGS
jgi:hypothetical protein